MTKEQRDAVITYLFNELHQKLGARLNDCHTVVQVAEVQRQVDELHHKFTDILELEAAS